MASTAATVILSILVLIKSSREESNVKTILPVCDHLPPDCRYINHRRQYTVERNSESGQSTLTKKDWVYCEDAFEATTRKQFETFLDMCLQNKPPSIARVLIYLSVSIRLSRAWSSILNDSFQLFNFTSRRDFTLNSLKLWNLNGFDIDSSVIRDLHAFNLEFYTDFNLYKNKRLVTTCRDYLDENLNLTFNDSSRQFISRSKPIDLINLFIYRPQTIHPICSLFFQNARIQLVSFSLIANSFYMKNSLSFIDFGDQYHDLNLNSKIKYAYFLQIYMIDLDAKILNPHVFKSITLFKLTGHLRSIETNVFEPFSNLRLVYFYSSSMLKLIRRQGIEWIRKINANVNVDVANLTAFRLHASKATYIYLCPDRFERPPLYAQHNNADFCLFMDFPFRQMVFIRTLGFFKHKPILTCTELWLYRFMDPIYYNQRDIFERTLKASNFTACDFEKRFQMCNRSNFHFSTTATNNFTWFDLIIVFELSFTVILPALFGAFGIFTNILVIRVIFDEKNKKTMRQKHYIYMSLHCLSNVLICFIQFTNLLNECQYPYTRLFCSSIRHLVGIQYLRIIFGEYLNSVLRLVSNFAYFGFSICRLAKIGTNQSRFTMFVSDNLRISVYMGVVLVVSAMFSICKALQFDINFDSPDLSHPLPFIQNQSRYKWRERPGFMAIYVINIIYNFLNYFFFVLVHLIVDVMLVRQLRQVMQEKEKKLREMKRSEKEMENSSKENEESKRRAVLMVICNSTLNFCLKIPYLIPSLNDFRILFAVSPLIENKGQSVIVFNLFTSPLNFASYCLSQKSCILFQLFGNCLFLVSLCTIYFFLKSFDMNFKCACLLAFNKTKTSMKK